MGVLEKLNIRRKKEEPVKQEERKLENWYYQGGLLGLSSFNETMNLSAWYCGVNQISDTVASLPINIMKFEDGIQRRTEHNLYQVLNVKPNQRHTRFTMMKMLIECVYLKGNGYLYIDRDEQLNCKQLILINPDIVQPIITESGDVKYLVSGMQSAVDASDMVHLYLHIDEYHNGISVIRYAAKSIDSMGAAEKQASNFFKSGGNLSGVIKSGANFNDEQRKQALNSFAASIGGDKIGIAMLPPGWDFQTVSVNPEDAELLESRKWNVIEVARWLKIPPTKLMSWEGTSYNGAEMADIAYLKDTIAPLCNMIELEFNKKLFKPSQVGKLQVNFDYDILLETDKKSMAQYYREMISNGVMSINEVRNALGLEPVEGEGCDTHFIQLSYAGVDAIAEGMYVKQNAQDQGGKTKNDNKVVQTEE